MQHNATKDFTVRNSSIAFRVKELKSGFVKCIRGAQKPLKRLKLGERNETVFACVRNAGHQLHRVLFQ